MNAWVEFEKYEAEIEARGEKKGLREGKKEGLKEGKKEGLIEAVRGVCEVLDLPINAGQEEMLQAASVEELEALLMRLRRHRSWR